MRGIRTKGTRVRSDRFGTIAGLAPTLASGWEDDGMRSGIPEEGRVAGFRDRGCSATRMIELAELAVRFVERAATSELERDRTRKFGSVM